MENKVYQMVTDKIVENMSKGIIPWHKPWHLNGSEEEVAVNYVTRRPYSLVNQWLLMEPGEVAFFGSKSYSREELVAEIGAAMLCSNFAVDTKKAFRNSIAYLQSWVKELKNDPKAIVVAAGKAEKAARFILGERD